MQRGFHAEVIATLHCDLLRPYSSSTHDRRSTFRSAPPPPPMSPAIPVSSRLSRTSALCSRRQCTFDRWTWLREPSPHLTAPARTDSSCSGATRRCLVSIRTNTVSMRRACTRCVAWTPCNQLFATPWLCVLDTHHACPCCLPVCRSPAAPWLQTCSRSTTNRARKTLHLSQRRSTLARVALCSASLSTFPRRR